MKLGTVCHSPGLSDEDCSIVSTRCYRPDANGKEISKSVPSRFMVGKGGMSGVRGAKPKTYSNRFAFPSASGSS